MPNYSSFSRVRPVFTPLAGLAFETLGEETLRGLLRALCGDVEAFDSPVVLETLIRSGILTDSNELAKGLIAPGVRIPKPRR
jgi:hypothetical protein